MTSHLSRLLELFLAAGLHSLTWLDPEFLYWWVPFRSRPESVGGCRHSRVRPSYTLPNPWLLTVKDTLYVLLRNKDLRLPVCGLNTNQIMKQNLHVKEPGMRVLKHFSDAKNL
jgi:hypothetical protein